MQHEPDKELSLRGRRRMGRAFLVFGFAPGLCAALLLLVEAVLAWQDLAPAHVFRSVRTPQGVYLEYDPHGPLPGAVFHRTRLDPLPAGTRRIVCLGGSTTFGHPFVPPAAFSDWLCARLPHLLPEAPIEVVNLGSNGLYSEDLRRIAEDLEATQVDLLVLYLGHNEFLPEHWPDRSAERDRIRAFLRCSRLGRLLLTRGSSHADTTTPPSSPGARVTAEPILSADQIQRGQRRLAENLESLLADARERGVRVLVCLPASDARDTPVERSHFAADRSSPLRERVRSFLDRAIPTLPPPVPAPAMRAELESRLGQVRSLEEAAPEVAALRFVEGRLLLALGEWSAGLAALEDARDRDDLPIRATSVVRERIREVSRRGDAIVADAALVLEERGEDAERRFVDYCHPDREGQRRIADCILHALADAGWCAPTAEWAFDREPPAEEYAAAFAVGKEDRATELAQRALAVLSQAWFAAQDENALGGAESLLALALEEDERCPLALAARAFVACLRGDAEAARLGFARARALDAAALAPFVQAFDTQPVVRAALERAGLGRTDLTGAATEGDGSGAAER